MPTTPKIIQVKKIPTKKNNSVIQPARLTNQTNTNKSPKINACRSSSSQDINIMSNLENDGWKTQKIKRNLSSSSSDTSYLNTVSTLNKTLFTSRNRFEALTLTQNDAPEIDTTNPLITEETHDTVHIKPPPPIFMKSILDFPNLCSALIELIGVDKFSGGV